MNMNYIIAIIIIAITGFYFEFYHNKDRVIDDRILECMR